MEDKIYKVDETNPLYNSTRCSWYKAIVAVLNNAGKEYIMSVLGDMDPDYKHSIQETLGVPDCSDLALFSAIFD